MDKFIISRHRFITRAGKDGLDLPAFKGSALRGVMGRAKAKRSTDWWASQRTTT